MISRPGVSLIELMIGMLLVAILARIAMPAYERITIRAHAAAALGDIQAVRAAVYSYNADTNAWPPDTGPGVTPPELEPYLGEGFSFEREQWQLDWENWVLPDGTPKHPGTGVLLGVSITTQDDLLGATIEDLVGSSTAHYTLGDNYTFVMLPL